MAPCEPATVKRVLRVWFWLYSISELRNRAETERRDNGFRLDEERCRRRLHCHHKLAFIKHR